MNSIKIANNLLHTKNHEVLDNDKVKLTSAGGGDVASDTSIPPSVDPDDRKGWLSEKSAGDATKFNYYMYGSTASSHPGTWYHSRRSYSINTSNQKIIVGEHINLYSGDKPDFKNNNRSIPLESITDTGDCLDSEVINTISVHSDSSSLIGTRILVSDMGWNLGHEIKRNIKLIT